jgi:Copine
VNILAKYDSDKQFPVLGFGAKYGNVVRHCFQCGPTAEANGVQGVLDAYHAVFKSGLIMSGPTVFTEVIATAAARAISAQVCSSF